MSTIHKLIVLNNEIDSDDVNDINTYFNNGWRLKHTERQDVAISIAGGGQTYTTNEKKMYGSVLIFLEKDT